MDWNWVNLPHTWNALDGNDGGNDYFRGNGYYAKALDKMDLPEADRYYLEIQGANSSADVYLNGKHLAHHDGGYSTWRVDITETLERENLFAIVVNNEANHTVCTNILNRFLYVSFKSVTHHRCYIFINHRINFNKKLVYLFFEFG